MKRREMLATLAAGSAGTLLEACGPPSASTPGVTAKEIQTMSKAMTGSDCPVKDAEKIRANLHSYRFANEPSQPGDVDPRIQPALMFDPEVDLG